MPAVHRVADPMVSPGCSKVRPIPRVILGLNPRTRTSEAPAAAGCRCRKSATGVHRARRTPLLPVEGPSRGQKPPNGAPKGVTYSTLSRQLPAPRPSFIAAKPRRVSRAWLKAVVTDLRPSPPRGRCRNGAEGGNAAFARPMITPSVCVTDISPQGEIGPPVADISSTEALPCPIRKPSATGPPSPNANSNPRPRPDLADARGHRRQAALYRSRPRRRRSSRIAARLCPLHPWPACHHVCRPAVDDPAICRLLHGGSLQRLLSQGACGRPAGRFRRLRSRHPPRL